MKKNTKDYGQSLFGTCLHQPLVDTIPSLVPLLGQLALQFTCCHWPWHQHASRLTSFRLQRTMVLQQLWLSPSFNFFIQTVVFPMFIVSVNWAVLAPLFIDCSWLFQSRLEYVCLYICFLLCIQIVPNSLTLSRVPNFTLNYSTQTMALSKVYTHKSFTLFVRVQIIDSIATMCGSLRNSIPSYTRSA